MSPVCFEKQVPSTLTGQTWTWPHLAVKPAFLQHRTLIDKWTTCRLSVRVEFYDRLGLTRKVVALAIRPSKRERRRISLEAIIFDFDFTLADSSRGIVDCVGGALQELGVPIPSDEVVMDTIGLSLAETFKCLTGQTGAEMTAHFIRCFHHRADQVMDRLTLVYECVPPVLRSLRSATIRTGVVSTKLNYRIRNILKRNNLVDLFDIVVGADNVSESKPDPEGLLLAMRSLSVNSSAVLYIGDHLVDAETAQRAGVGFVAVLSGRHSRNHFQKVPHLAILDTVQQLPALLGLGENTLF